VYPYLPAVAATRLDDQTHGYQFFAEQLTAEKIGVLFV
jgi:hypothetical protein